METWSVRDAAAVPRAFRWQAGTCRNLGAPPLARSSRSGRAKTRARSGEPTCTDA